MPVFQLEKEIFFPDPFLAEDGLLAVGGDLSPERLLLAYSNGIFPWYNSGEPILWHAPNPRFVLFPEKIKISKSLSAVIKKKVFSVTENTAFVDVINQCKKIPRLHEDGTWITDEMVEAYVKLHKMGFAHSIEVWNKSNELIGGLYGVLLNKTFFGESMFHKESNASKVALAYLANREDIKLIDCQVYTEHLASLGAEEIDLKVFLSLIKNGF